MQSFRRIKQRPLRYWSKLSSSYASLSVAKQTAVQDAAIWGVTLLCIWWISRELSFHKLLTVFEGASIWMLVAANVLSFLVWWLVTPSFSQPSFPFSIRRAVSTSYFRQPRHSTSSKQSIFWLRMVRWLSF
jgi:hypothetical protein